MSAGALVPLGAPAQNGKKMFSSRLIQQMQDDPKMLDKFTELIRIKTKEKNKRTKVSNANSKNESTNSHKSKKSKAPRPQQAKKVRYD
jgi:hypothetical protein